KSGANSGGQFWGCTNYPKCRGIVQYQPTAN
ncbi:MAG: topoisomerase DNA-binding C4 zinc finger domain-containing protein, partial [Caldilineaceae bacterium]|nr:topoisomerase DNA-binding C4 zinc finger domain-containing protein [Caldilineaceae bacterium]